MSRVLLLNVLALAAARDGLSPFNRLQVSSPMNVKVVTDPSRGSASLDIAADGMGLGWTVQAMVQPMTFGRTLLLGMDDRAVRQGFQWPSQAREATLWVPEPLMEVSATGGAQVLVDEVFGALLADAKSNLTVLNFETQNQNRSTIFMASTGANITVKEGYAGRAFVSVGSDCTVKLECRVDEVEVEAAAGAHLIVNADDVDIRTQASDDAAVIEVLNSTAELTFPEAADLELRGDAVIP